ncbi:MAG: sigma-54-dependent Fis family transcriptional regulator [Acidobacteria bacterium]|nr:sigma-54-dependent Fis family transcriptional regulator [Acidobacteriota bacterium]
MSKASILVVDDEKGVQTSLSAILQDEGFRVETVGSGEECLGRLVEKEFDVVLLDIWLPEMDGLETLEAVQSLGKSCSVVIISGHGTIETAVRATKLGAFDFLEKPLSIDKTLLVVNNALRQKKLQEENENLRNQLFAEAVMIGNSVPMRALRQQISYAAPTNGRILIYGENGTGKELVAKQIHRQSLRATRPFVEVNCAAIPEDLIESELFGHVKGAFTGATERRQGKFRLADGGTLFLDEVGDMSLRTQSKVLRVLEEQRFHMVGDTEDVEIDVRVVAATNKSLELEIERGNFREDLYYRLNVIPFQVPPLRERREDVPRLVDYFLARFSTSYGKKPKEITPDVMEKLQRYPWPGNVRELKNVVERLVIMVPGPRIDIYALPTSILETTSLSGSPEEYPTLQQAREQFEKEFILRKLIENKGNVSKTAEAIKVERSNLYKKLKAYDLEF